MAKRIFKIKNLVALLFIVFIITAFAFSPLASFAADTFGDATGGATSYSNIRVCNGDGVGNVICNIHKLLNSIVPVLLALGVVYFIWGVVQYMIGGGDEAKTEGRDRIIYGIIGFAVILSVWGLASLVTNTFGFGGQNINIPNLVPTANQVNNSTCELGPKPKLQTVIGYITCSIQTSVIPLLFAAAVVFFLWGVIQFVILGAGEEAKRTQGRQHMIWGIIALAVMMGVWSLAGIVGGTFELERSVLPTVKPMP